MTAASRGRIKCAPYYIKREYFAKKYALITRMAHGCVRSEFQFYKKTINGFI